MFSKTLHKTRILLLLVFVLCSGTLFLGCGGTDDKNTQTIDIGVLLPLTGDLGNFGETVLNGVRVAVKNYEDTTSTNIRIVAEDTQGNTTDAVSAFRKLTSVNNVDIIVGALTSGSTIAVEPLAEKQKVLLMSPTASSPKLTDSGPHFFRVWPSDSYSGRVAAQYVSNRMSHDIADILYLNNDYASGLAEVFRKTFEREGNNVNIIDSFTKSRTNFRTVLTKIQSSSSGVIYVPGHPNGIGSILTQADDLNIEKDFFSNVAAEDKEFLRVAGSSATGLHFTAPAFDTTRSDTKSFMSAYKRTYGTTPDIHAVKGHDATTIVLRAISATSSTALQDLSSFLHSGTGFNGVGGTYIFRESGSVRTDIAIKMYNEKLEIKTVETVSPRAN